MPATAAGVTGSGLALNLGGDIAVKRFSIGYGNCTAAAATQTIALFTLPAESLVLGVRVKLRTVFAGTGITALTFTLGVPINTGFTPNLAANLVKYGAAFDLMQAITPTGPSTRITGPTLLSGPSTGTELVNAYLTATGANLGPSIMTAGMATIDFYLLVQTTPTTAGQ